MTEPLTLKDPITKSDGSEIKELTLGTPRLVHVQKLVLAIGPDTIRVLLDHFDEANGAGDESGRKLLALVIGELIKQERFDAFNEALGSYLRITADEAGLISPTDLFEVGKKVIDFFPELASMIAGLVKEDETA